VKVHLITTALPENNADRLPAVLLGSWCRLYETERSGADVLPFHWDDRQKFDRDYAYLRGLHGRLLGHLATELNTVHGIERSVRYWRLMLDPWLLSYLGTMFDRWEAIRVAMETHESVVVDREEPAFPTPAVGWPDFTKLAGNDRWNRQVFADILQRAYPGRCTFAAHPAHAAEAVGVEATATPEDMAGHFKQLTIKLRSMFERHACRRDRIFFHGHHLPVRTFVAISLRLGQWPRLRSAFPDAGNLLRFAESQNDAGARRSLLRGVVATSGFEQWLIGRIGRDLPVGCLEAFPYLRSLVADVKADCSIIFTSTANWFDEPFRVWCAEKVAAGCRLIVSEHGGSLPARGVQFDYEESIADTKVTWFSATHSNHQQLPAGKLLEHRPSATAGPTETDCIVVIPDFNRYVFRAAYAALAGQIETTHAMVLALERRLDESVRRSFKIKAAPGLDSYRNTVKHFSRHLGSERVITTESLDEVLQTAKVIVCTYPETTFSEAMVTGRPVIMMYPPQYYERHAAAEPLMLQLAAVGIIHHDAASAATHLNRIWRDPLQWWRQTDVAEARNAFLRTALGQSGDAQGDWVRFFKRELQKPATSIDGVKHEQLPLGA
jgi:putative transferase (TIGR04331 family)